MKSLALVPILIIQAIFLAGCPAPEIPGSGLPNTGNPESDAGPELGLALVAQGLNRPLFAAAAPGQPGRVYIVEQGGRIRIAEGGGVRAEHFLDIAPLVGSTLGERGLLGLAFHPAYEANGRFYVYYTNTEGAAVLALYCRFADDEYRADPATATVLLTIPQPFNNHNGGMLAFGPDGYLYVASGDGGSGNDPRDNGQSLDTLLGKILRIDVDGAAPYAVPPDNPFVGVAGVLPEIWAYGLRNPWRMSFDRETGDLWIADVGQNALEEINFQPAESPGGENYGWRNREGSICRPGETQCALPGAVDPIYEYSREGSQSITGGYVYRGAVIPDLAGTYFFADFISGEVFSLVRDGDSVAVANETAALNSGAITITRLASFGEDSEGELLLVDYGAGAVYRLTVDS